MRVGINLEDKGESALSREKSRFRKSYLLPVGDQAVKLPSSHPTAVKVGDLAARTIQFGIESVQSVFFVVATRTSACPFPAQNHASDQLLQNRTRTNKLTFSLIEIPPFESIFRFEIFDSQFTESFDLLDF